MTSNASAAADGSRRARRARSCCSRGVDVIGDEQGLHRLLSRLMRPHADAAWHQGFHLVGAFRHHKILAGPAQPHPGCPDDLRRHAQRSALRAARVASLIAPRNRSEEHHSSRVRPSKDPFDDNRNPFPNRTCRHRPRLRCSQLQCARSPPRFPAGARRASLREARRSGTSDTTLARDLFSDPSLPDAPLR